MIYDGYGQTETVLLVGNFRCNEVRPGSMGLPAPGFTIGVVDEQGNEVPAGEEGQIAVKIKPEEIRKTAISRRCGQRNRRENA